MRARQTFALGGFALQCSIRSRIAIGGIIMGCAVMVLGAVVGIFNDLSWRFDPDFGFFGFLLMALFLVRSGLEEQRELGMADFFRQNFVTPTEHGLSLILTVLGASGVCCGITFVAILLISVGDVGLAIWAVGAWGTRLLLLVGVVPAVERLAPVRLPLLVPAMVYLVLVVMATLVLPEDSALALFVPVGRGDVPALGRLARQVGMVLPLSCLLSLAVVTDGFGGLPRIRQLWRVRLSRRPHPSRHVRRGS